MFDCIEVDISSGAAGPSSPIHVESQKGNDDSTAKTMPIKRRGRPRKRHSNNHLEEQVPPRDQAKDKNETHQSNSLSRSRSRRHFSPVESVEPDVANEKMQEVGQDTAPMEPILPEQPHAQAERKGDMSVAIVSGLQAVLDQVKSANSASFDLRAVDELCFQIRFHAQIAPQRSHIA